MQCLLVDQMFSAGLDASLLHSKNGFVCSFSSKERIGAEPFPIPSALRNSAYIHHGTQSNIDTFANVLLAHGVATQTNQLAIEAKSYGQRQVKAI